MAGAGIHEDHFTRIPRSRASDFATSCLAACRAQCKKHSRAGEKWDWDQPERLGEEAGSNDSTAGVKRPASLGAGHSAERCRG